MAVWVIVQHLNTARSVFMKKEGLFLFVALLCSGQLMAKGKGAADFFIEFNTMEEGHKKDWLEYCDRQHTRKTKLLENQMHGWIELKNNHLKQARKMMDCSAEAKDAKMASHLDAAVKLHEKHKEMWKEWCEKSHNEALNIAERHDKQLESFKKKYHGKYEEAASMKNMEAK